VDVDRLILYMHWLMAVLFVGWLLYFVYALWRFRASRSPKADYVGVTSHTSSWIEVAVAVIEGVLLIGFAIPWWARAVEDFPDPKESVVLRVIGQQFAWNGIYAGTNGVFGKQDMRLANADNRFGFVKDDPNGADDFTVMGELQVPVGKPVIAHVSSLDVIHSFKVTPLRVTQDATPGMSVPIHFKATKTGTMQIQCAQLCGNGHAKMRGLLQVVSPEDYDKWVAEKISAPKATGGFE
jgi:cytochrome c oxidase subunit 2